MKGDRYGAKSTMRSAPWVAYGACVWALVFAAISFYWAAGGTAGSNTIGPAITNMAHDPAFIAVLWVTGTFKLLGGLLALALVRPWGRALPRRVLLTAAWGGGILMALYGAASWIQEGLMVGGVLRQIEQRLDPALRRREPNSPQCPALMTGMLDPWAATT